MAQGRVIEKHKFRVKLTEEERVELGQVARSERAANWKRTRAWALGKADEGEGGPGWPDAKIAEACDVSRQSVENWRKQALDQGPLSLMERKTQDRSPHRKLDGAGQAKLAQLACSSPPAGRRRWSVRLLADQLVVLEVVDSISPNCVAEHLKKTR